MQFPTCHISNFRHLGLSDSKLEPTTRSIPACECTEMRYIFKLMTVFKLIIFTLLITFFKLITILNNHKLFCSPRFPSSNQGRKSWAAELRAPPGELLPFSMLWLRTLSCPYWLLVAGRGFMTHHSMPLHSSKSSASRALQRLPCHSIVGKALNDFCLEIRS